MEDAKKASDDKVRAAWKEDSAMGHFMAETLANFAYRYFGSAEVPNPQVEALDEKTLRVVGRESSMVLALKIADPIAQTGIKELARTVPKAQGPAVAYALTCELRRGDANAGELVITATVDWGFPSHDDSHKRVSREKAFKWGDLQVFRKGFPLAVQDACELFL